MTEFNPLAGSVLGSTQAQHQVSVEKQRQVRRAQALSKNVAARDDELEHQVESSEQLPPVQDEQREHPNQRRQSRSPNDDESPPRLDVTA